MAAVTERVTLRLPETLAEKVRYWADKHNVSANEYIREAIEQSIRFENGDYPLMTAEQARLNQLVAGQITLTTTVENLQRAVETSMQSLLSIVHGDNYLDTLGQPEEEGEL